MSDKQLTDAITKLNAILTKFGRQDSGWSGDDRDISTEQAVGMQRFNRQLKDVESASQQLSRRLQNLVPRRAFDKVIRKFEDAGDEILDAATAIGVKSQRSTMDYIKRSRANAEQMRKIANMHAEITSDVSKLQDSIEKKNKEVYTKTFKALEEKVEQFRAQGIDTRHLEDIVKNISIVGRRADAIVKRLERTDIDSVERQELTEALDELNLNMRQQYSNVVNSQRAQQSMFINFNKEYREASAANSEKIANAMKTLGAGIAVDISRLGNVIESELRNVRGLQASDHLLALQTGLSPAMLNELQQQNLRLTTLTAEQRNEIQRTTRPENLNEALRDAGRANQNALIERISADASRYGYFGQDAQVFMNDVMSGMKTAGMGDAKLQSGQYTSQALTSILGSNAQLFEMTLGEAAKEMGDFINQPEIRARMFGLNDTQRLAVIKRESVARQNLVKTLGMSIEMQKQFNAEQRQRKFASVADKFRQSILRNMAFDEMVSQGYMADTPELRQGMADDNMGRATDAAVKFRQAFGAGTQIRAADLSKLTAGQALAEGVFLDAVMTAGGYDPMAMADNAVEMDANKRLISTAGGMESFSEDITKFSDAMTEHTGLLQKLYVEFKPYFSGVTNSAVAGTAGAVGGLVTSGAGNVASAVLGGAGNFATELFSEYLVHKTIAGGGLRGIAGSTISSIGPQITSRVGMAGNVIKALGPRALAAGGVGALGVLGTMGGDALKESGHEKTGAAVSTLGYAATGAGMGMMLGPIGAAVGGTLGAAYGLFQNKETITGLVDSGLQSMGIDTNSAMGNAIENALYASPVGMIVGHEKIFENAKQAWNSLTGNLNEPASTVDGSVSSAATTGQVLQPDGTYAPPADKTAELVELNRRQVELSEEHLKLDEDDTEKRRREREQDRLATQYRQKAQQMRDNLIESALQRGLA